MKESYRSVGHPVLRVDTLDKLTGKALFAGDISFPNMLYLKVLRSDRPHAQILKIHTETARMHPGVVAVFTAKDIPGTNRIGPRNKDQAVLCDDKVRYVGDAVALIAAETLEAAEKAISLIRVDYEDLPGIFSPQDALAPEGVHIHESGNLLLERTLCKGNPDQTLEQAEVVISNTYRTQMVEHGYIEPEAGVACCEGEKVTVWIPCRHLHSDQKEIASVLGLPLEKVRCILATVGGSFGDKQGLGPGYYAALASLKTGRPCKMIYSREESFMASSKRHPFVIHYTTGATRQGLLVAVKVEITADTGAYTSYGPSVLLRALIHAAGPYEIPNVSIKVRAVFKNNTVGGAMRGFGVAQMVFAHETQMDILAETLHMDPFEIRLRNSLQPGSLTSTGQALPVSVGLAETIEKVRAEIRKRGTPAPYGAKRYGWGISSMFYGIGSTAIPNPGFARILSDDSGNFILHLGCGDMGQGSDTVMSQIAAEVLQIRTEKMQLVKGDTELCPDAGTASASRLTYVVGRSVQMAAENLRALLQEFASSIMEVTQGDLILDRGFFYQRGYSERRISVAEVVRLMQKEKISPMGEGRFDPATTPLDPDTGQGVPYGTYAFATQGALVSVDVNSGEVEVLEVLAAHDVGKALNTLNVVGQIEGGVAMGVGYGLMEEVFLKNGRIQNPRFSEYFIPTSLDVPGVTPLIVENQEPTGPFGAKGVGEPALLPTAPAILNAIASVLGEHPKEIPMTSEKVWGLLKGKTDH